MRFWEAFLSYFVRRSDCVVDIDIKLFSDSNEVLMTMQVFQCYRETAVS